MENYKRSHIYNSYFTVIVTVAMGWAYVSVEVGL